MQVGVIFLFQNYGDALSDADAFRRDVALADLAEPLGFDILACTEHHFSNYSMIPDNIGFLNFMAGRTKSIKLLTAAVILPWHQPLRVISNMIVLDHLSQGRALFGIGRGLARSEFEPFGLDMSESRDRFNESADLVMRALETGVAEGEGPFYKQPRTEIRPQPYASFKDRFYCVAMSPDSVDGAARLGGRMKVFSNHKTWAEQAPQFHKFRELFEQYHGRPAPPPVTTDFLICDESADRAAELAHKHMKNYYLSVIVHNDWATFQFDKVKGYASYAVSSQTLREIGPEAAADKFVTVNAWGTPQQILDQLRARWDLIGPFDEMVQPSYGALSREDAERSMRLYAEKVIPELRSWTSDSERDRPRSSVPAG
jgi:alkanesulfonate monooxygenase SsuD/methylene tetrahydromethanopterin reductase-like flavin-dependent oxidoreductase (luciferase family)